MMLVKFYYNCGRMGSLKGLFFLSDFDWQRLELACETGATVTYREVLGKHSEIEYTFSRYNFRVLNVSQQTVEELRREVGDLVVGINPLDTLDEQNEGEY